jgi:hypothetical protein
MIFGFGLYTTLISPLNASLHSGLAAGNCSFFFLVVILLEIYHRRFLKQHVTLEEPIRVIKREEFERLITEDGKKLLLLDDLVLDCEIFMLKHPGGKFAIQQNIGRDISKFFHGSYAFEGNVGRSSDPPSGHKHSNYARLIVNQLCIARLESTSEGGSYAVPLICKVSNAEKRYLNDDVVTFAIETSNGDNIPSVSNFHSTLEHLGKHFLVQSAANPAIQRHYTISNIMNPAIYDEFINCLKGEGSNNDLLRLIEPENSHKQYITVKNYKSAKGVSARLHRAVVECEQKDFDELDNRSSFEGFVNQSVYKSSISGDRSSLVPELKDDYQFIVRGPLGKGLMVK